jgi:hypothetical protein
MDLLKKAKVYIKKRKKSFVVGLIVSITGASCAGLNEIGHYRIQNIVMKQQQIVKPVSDKIDSFEKRAVLRPDFNAYINRKDSEYHEQIRINSYFQQKLGQLDGKIEEDDKILNRLSMQPPKC